MTDYSDLTSESRQSAATSVPSTSSGEEKLTDSGIELTDSSKVVELTDSGMELTVSGIELTDSVVEKKRRKERERRK